MLRRHRTLGKFGKQKRDVIGMADKKSQKFKPRKLGIGEEIHSADNTAENFQMYTRSSVKRMKYSNDNSDSELKIIGDAEDSQQVNKQEHYQRRSNRLKNLSVDNPQFADSLNRNCFSKGRKRLHQKASEGKRVSSGKSRELNRTTSKRWQLICSTYDDWRTLVENMSGSSNKCEKDLVKLIEQNFLQTIKMMCLDKVSKCRLILTDRFMSE